MINDYSECFHLVIFNLKITGNFTDAVLMQRVSCYLMYYYFLMNCFLCLLLQYFSKCLDFLK